MKQSMNRPLLLAVVLAAAIAAPAWAADNPPTEAVAATISGPKTAAPGQLVKLRAQLVYQRDWLRIAGSLPENPPAFRWALVNPPDGYQIEEWIFRDGRTCVFATGRPGVYRFILAGTRLDAEGKPRLFLARHTLTVEPAGPPEPDPDPEPDPGPPEPQPPGPELPEGRFGLAQWTYRSAREHVPADSRSVAGALAENYRGIAARIAAGTLTEAREILAATTRENRRAVGEEIEAWMPFFRKLAVRMRELDEAEKIVSPEDFQQAWTEIATGLETVSN